MPLVYLVDPEAYDVSSQEEAMTFLRRIGLKTNPELKIYKDIDNVYNRILKLSLCDHLWIMTLMGSN